MAPITPNDVQTLLDRQRAQLVSTFTQAAASMRAAAQEAEAAAALFGAIGANFSADQAALASLNARLQLTTNNTLAGIASAVNGINSSVDATAPTKKRRRNAKEKNVKDPNAPKRPTGAYILFQNDIRKQVQEQMPGATQHTILAEVSQLWKDLDPGLKQAYYDQVEKAKKDYDVKKRDYDAHKEENGPFKELLADEPTPAKSSEEDGISSDEAEKEEEEEESEEEQEQESQNDTSSSDEEQPTPPPKKKQRGAPAPPPSRPSVSSATADKSKKKQPAAVERSTASRKSTGKTKSKE
ncbi:hypothetical protein FRC03_004640 [Tulasnella sp. 419]|nr:hypothetical protein FRC03_004640 [Tulasnella sp. 419]